MDDVSEPKARLTLLLHRFAAVDDGRQSWRVTHPPREVLFLMVCGTIANGDDDAERLGFPRGFSAFHRGIPCVDWLRTLMNRVDPDVFSACFRD